MNLSEIISLSPQQQVEHIRTLALSILSPRINGSAYFYVFLIEATLGIVSNLLVLVAFAWNRQLRNRRNVYIVNLVLGNLLNSVTLLPLVYFPQTNTFWEYGSIACKLFNGFSGMFVYLTTFAVMAISIDRYYYVRTTHANKPRGLAHSVLVCCFMWLLSLALVSPLLLFYNAKTTYINAKKLSDIFDLPESMDFIYLGTRCELNMPIGLQVVVTTLQTAFLLPIPLIVMSIYSYKLHRLLHSRTRNFGPMSLVRLRRSKNVTILLIAMVAIFAVVWLPFHAITIVFDFSPPQSNTEGESQLVMLDVMFQLIGYTSLFLNTLLYGLLNRNFKRCLKNMLCKRRQRAKSEASPELQHNAVSML